MTSGFTVTHLLLFTAAPTIILHKIHKCRASIPNNILINIMNCRSIIWQGRRDNDKLYALLCIYLLNHLLICKCIIILISYLYNTVFS